MCISPSSILNKSRVGHADSAELTQEALRVPGGVHGLDHTATDELPWNSAGGRKTLLNSRKRKPVWLCVQAVHVPAMCLPVTRPRYTCCCDTRPCITRFCDTLPHNIPHPPTPIPYIIIIPAICLSETHSLNTSHWSYIIIPASVVLVWYMSLWNSPVIHVPVVHAPWNSCLCNTCPWDTYMCSYNTRSCDTCPPDCVTVVLPPPPPIWFLWHLVPSFDRCHCAINYLDLKGFVHVSVMLVSAKHVPVINVPELFSVDIIIIL